VQDFIGHMNLDNSYVVVEEEEEEEEEEDNWKLGGGGGGAEGMARGITVLVRGLVAVLVGDRGVREVDCGDESTEDGRVELCIEVTEEDEEKEDVNDNGFKTTERLGVIVEVVVEEVDEVDDGDEIEDKR